MAALGMNVNFSVLFTRGKIALVAAGISSVLLLILVATLSKTFF